MPARAEAAAARHSCVRRAPAARWGNNVDWTANEAKFDTTRGRPGIPLARQFLPYDGYELQLRRSRYSGRSWRVRVELRDFEQRRADLVFPRGSRRQLPLTCAVLVLGDGEAEGR